MGAAVAEETFVRICLALQEQGAENINLVTGSHAVPAIALGLKAARARGLAVPVLWNSSAYEGDPALDLLEDTVDVYLPDLKTLDPSVSGRFFKAPDYPAHAERAVLRMIGSRGLRYGPPRRSGASGVQGRPGVPQVLVSGVVIRHLVLPGYLGSTREVLRWFADHGRGRALLSLMTQYTPPLIWENGGETPKTPGMPERELNKQEYETVLRWLEEFDIGDGFYQELVSGDQDWLPDFRRENPFPPDLFRPIWHWNRGFV
jgi:putative pyruvate formate lyase activating enzyme